MEEIAESARGLRLTLRDARETYERLREEDGAMGVEQQALKANLRHVNDAIRTRTTHVQHIKVLRHVNTVREEIAQLERERQAARKAWSTWEVGWKRHCTRLQHATSSYEEIREEASILLAKLRHAQVEYATARTAYRQAECADMVTVAERALAQMIGAEEAQALAHDRTQKGSWQ